MDIKISSVIGAWSLGTSAKAKYFTAKEQNKDDVCDALGEFVYSNKFRILAWFSAFVSCNDNPKLSGSYHVSLYFNDSGDTFFKLDWNELRSSKYLLKLRNKDIEKYRAVTQDLFKAIVDTEDFKWIARKATKNIQVCFKDVIEPLYKGELRVSDDLDFDRDEAIEEQKGREAINKLMKIKGKIVSSSASNLSHPELENM